MTPRGSARTVLPLASPYMSFVTGHELVAASGLTANRQ
jgi:hypothetical protein